MKIRPIYGDFMKVDDNGHLKLNSAGTFRDLDSQGIQLERGMRIAIYSDDENANGQPDNLVVEGVVDFDEDNKIWVAKINFAEIRNVSQLSEKERQRFGL